MAARWFQMVGRTGAFIKQESAKLSNGVENHPTSNLSLYKFRTEADVKGWIHGSDASIGGTSTSHWALGEDGRAKFWGHMRLAVKPEVEGRFRGGYAGIRCRAQPTLFGPLSTDLQKFKYLSLRLRCGKGIRDAWFVNVRTAQMPEYDLWQHRLLFRDGGDYQEIQVPLDQFTYTRKGQHFAESQETFEREKVVMVGLSVLGGNAGLEGPYELGVDEMWATNERSSDHNAKPKDFPDAPVWT